jgi:hypothetical protein
MSNDITVQAIGSAQTGSEPVADARPTAALAPPQARAAPSTAYTNPSLRLDPALGLVVIEFRNAAGVVTTSVPSQQQLAAYQRWETTRIGTAPPGQGRQAASKPEPVPSHGTTKPAHLNRG